MAVAQAGERVAANFCPAHCHDRANRPQFARLRSHPSAMAPANPKSEAAATRLYLMTPRIEDAAAFLPVLTEALDSADIAAVLLRLGDNDERAQINCIKALAPVVQAKDIALLLDGRAELVARGGADGAHLSGIKPFSDALATLKPVRIAGCGGLASRHDAMLAAEQGADYVMFGDAIEGHRASFEAILERVAWWEEVFEVPCVGYAERLDEVGPLAAAGADFVALGDFVWSDPRGVAAGLDAAARSIKSPEAVA